MRALFSLGIIAGLLVQGCYPVGVRRDISPSKARSERKVEAPTKVHLINGDVILCPNGFFVTDGFIQALGVRFDRERRGGRFLSTTAVPWDSIVGIEYYKEEVTPASAGASLLLAASSTAVVVAGTALLAVAIFGSCPTVYVAEGDSADLQAEGFSFSVGQPFEMADLDRLTQPPTNRDVTLLLRNEALETHYINRFALGYVDHPAGTAAFPTDAGTVAVVRDIVAPLAARNSEWTEVAELVGTGDGRFYECDSATVARMASRDLRDRLTCTFIVPRDTRTATLLLRVKNSLLTTTLFYDVMMRDQGSGVFEWMDDVDGSFLSAWRLGKWYKEFSGIQVSVVDNGDRTSSGKVFNSGPLAWREVALPLSLGEHGDSVTVELSFVVDNWLIDWVGLAPGKADKAEPVLITAQPGSDLTDEQRAQMADDDEAYLVTYPGTSIRLNYKLPPPAEAQRTLFVSWKGFYTEWMRPEWLRQGDRDPRVFDVAEGTEPVRRAIDLWLAKKNRYASLFFASKVPTEWKEARP